MKNLFAALLVFLGTASGFFTSSHVYLKPFSPVTTTVKAEKIVQRPIPKHIYIPRLDVDTSVEAVGKDSQGRMDVPKNTNDVGWYDLGPAPGEKGSAVIDGHFDDEVGPSVFYNLSALSKGDTIQITTSTGKTETFVVTDKESYPDKNFPIKEVFAKNDKPRLNLITCGGVFDRTAKNYSNREVIYTELRK